MPNGARAERSELNQMRGLRAEISTVRGPLPAVTVRHAAGWLPARWLIADSIRESFHPVTFVLGVAPSPNSPCGRGELIRREPPGWEGPFKNNREVKYEPLLM